MTSVIFLSSRARVARSSRVEHVHELVLGPASSGHRLAPDGDAGLGHLDVDTAPVVGVGRLALHPPGLLQGVDPAGHAGVR